eukprot:TRINITY_DN3408_c0_g1_i3.p1 TRINITY_DN3408_c0_g1~~TRINITY_DN3408_c0_g1_i3.p1  ORF type:complete len:114 (-),score=43.44 TRINITY_DN3408_c0_g1_i3:203-544(-)
MLYFNFYHYHMSVFCFFFFFQAEDGIRDAQESRGLGDVYKRQEKDRHIAELQKQLKKVSAEKDSLLQAQLSAAQHALDTVSIGPQPYDLYRKEYAGDYLTRHKNEFYTAYKRL